ncbi:type II toxin-antitoxin system VapC family toxin [Oleomonas cavernae]|nr:type II toxin-antitoxin system VapC family toxin [Oleomonas cavernae]
MLVDTNVVSELVRPRPSPSVVAYLRNQTDLWLSVISLHELTYGAERAPDPVQRSKLLVWTAQISARFGPRIIDLDRHLAEAAGRLRAAADAQGRPADPLDALIAATAISRGLAVATRNTKDFEVFGVTLHNPWQPGA